MSNVHQINTTYQMNTEIQIDKTALKPYIVLIEVHYLNNEFRERIQNIVERYRPAFQVRRKNILKRILQKDNLDIKLVSLC
ncbi:hypothetical protein [Bacillus cytotoxicus]|uniref:hypothetical protein n=1 Tax=Bacillus cytotoxicus TaxID=580165 RepID=UPI003D7D48CA